MKINMLPFKKSFNVLLICAATITSFNAMAATNRYDQHNLVSDGSISADHIDAHLVNPWGLAFGPTTPAWVANNETSVSTIYDGTGMPLSLIVTTQNHPTGVVFNKTSGFVISKEGKSAAALFIFASESGMISGWAPSVSPTGIVVAVDHSALGAVYTGLTAGADGTNQFLYAANFHTGNIEMYDSSFNAVPSAGGFIDPKLPAGFSPFNVQNVNGDIYVTYAKQNAAKSDAVKGAGLGYVSVFDAQGHFIRRVASAGKLNAPWGVALAPANFGKFSNQLLIGNFGDGKITAFDLDDSTVNAQINNADGTPMKISGLWSLVFGNGANQLSPDVLYFTAGPDDETHGIFGSIKPAV